MVFLGAIGTLTLAIALNVAGLTLMQTMLVRGYPLVERNDRLVYVQERGALGCCVALRVSSRSLIRVSLFTLFGLQRRLD